MAPELVIDGVDISRSTDMYAFGTLCWEVLTGQKPWDGSYNPTTRILAMREGKTLDFGAIPADTPPSVAELIRACLAFGEDGHRSGGRNARPSIKAARKVLEDALSVVQNGKFSIFLSYSWGPAPEHFRQPLARQVYEQLRDAGFRVWMDVYEMKHKIDTSMKEGINNSECVVVLLSPDYARSRACCFELKHASESGKPIIVCMVEPGFWKTWKNADESVCIDPKGEVAAWARLEQQMFVDLSEASEVDWKNPHKVSKADKSKLIEMPKAIPRLRQLLGEVGVESSPSYARAAAGRALEKAREADAAEAVEEERTKREKEEKRRRRKTSVVAANVAAAAADAVAAVALPAGELIKGKADELPEGWERRWVEDKQKHYYKNVHTGAKTWKMSEVLGEGGAAAAAAAAATATASAPAAADGRVKKTKSPSLPPPPC
jgi:hypothetical protein